MQSSTSRLNSIIMFGATILLTMSIINHIHGRYILYNPTPDISLSNIQILQFRNTTLWQQLSFKYTLKANLSSLYTWNLKQLFVYIEVGWVDEQGLGSRMVASDWILESPMERGLVGEKFVIDTGAAGKQIEYNVRDVHRRLRGKTVNVTLNAEYMPTVGFFFKTELYRTTLKVPDTYI